MKKQNRRILTALIWMIALAVLLPQNAYALSADVESKLDTMGTEVFGIYKLFLCGIAIPVLIVRFAACGFRVLGATFLSQGDTAIDKVKRDVTNSIIAMFVLFFLPTVIGWAIGIFSVNAWKPKLLP